VHLLTSGAVHSLIGLFVTLRKIVSSEALNVQAGIGATIDEERHVGTVNDKEPSRSTGFERLH
jgi:hypothetical protein